ncbi:FkbM family methyltransferase [Cytophagaceae bacterium ABcell3]|nr:FkbM family methyltransferase [Cytophagaceae bacterium ABcell3]
MKTKIKKALQKSLGFENYLFGFSLYKIWMMRYDSSERDFLEFMKLLPEEGVVLDIGANIGLMTVTLSRKFKKSQIFSFEPVPNNYKALKRVSDFFGCGNVSFFQHALGNEEKEMSMVMPVKDSVKMQGLCHMVDESIPKQSQGELFVTDVKRLDELECLKHDCGPVTGIKLDVEHFEWAVLEGGRELIKKYKPVIYCELADNMNRVKSFMLLLNLGYKAKVVCNGTLVDFDEKKHKNLNFIFVPI